MGEREHKQELVRLRKEFEEMKRNGVKLNSEQQRQIEKIDK